MNLLREEHGSVLVELALVMPVLASVLIGAVDYGLLLQRQLRLQSAAAAAEAWVAVPSNTSNLAGAQQVAVAAIADLSGAKATVQRYWTCAPGGSHVTSSSKCSGARTPMQWVQVDTYASGAPLISFPGLSTSDVIHVTAMERVQWIP